MHLLVMKWVMWSSSLVALLLITAPVQTHMKSAVEDDAVTQSAEVVIANTRKLAFVSKVNGHRYSISVALPFTKPPPHGYPALYVLDGDLFFASASEIARDRGIVVVGIGYPTDLPYQKAVVARRGPVPVWLQGQPLSQSVPMLERQYDLTLPTTDAALAADTLKGFPTLKRENVGGLDDFLKTIEEEVKPRVASLTRLDTKNQALFGHSFGGLAVVHALFVEPEAFRTFIAASPSIWWGEEEVLADEHALASAVRAHKARPRILVTVGGEESTPMRMPPQWGINPADEEAYYRKTRMVENGAALVASLKSLTGGTGELVADFVVFEKEQHGEAAWSALARGVPFAFDAEP